MKEWRPIETAPRDGTEIEVIAFDDRGTVEEGPFPMRWNCAGMNGIVSIRPGIWECGDNFTWCEDHGFGPTHWRPSPTPAAPPAPPRS
jgi:hypothetical protein